MRLVEDIRRSTTIREAPEESLMLTGDENIVDVEFSVFWHDRELEPWTGMVEPYPE